MFASFLLFGCTQPSDVPALSASRPIDLNLEQGESAVIAVDDASVKVLLRDITPEELLYLLSSAQDATPEEVLVLTDGTSTFVDLDSDAVPDVKLRVKEASSGSVPVVEISRVPSSRVARVAPKMCVEGFARASTASVVFILDRSLSMDYPARQESFDEVPPELRQQMEILQEKLPQLAAAVTEEELGLYLGSGVCRNVPSEQRELCNEVDDAFETSREIMRDSPSLYNEYSKMSAAKQTASTVLNAVRSAQRLSKAEVSVALVSFADYASIDTPLTSDFTYVQEGINDIETSPSTNIGDGLRDAFSELEAGDADNKVFVLLTDGRPSSGLTSSQITQEFVSRAKEAGVVIYTIGFGLIEEEIDGQLLETLAQDTSGSYSFASTGEELSRAFETALGVGRITC
ncbi:VWA domain-containing protein [Candidatus Micrarchaeota archaeon]|nr:VWA domain-containing protein [Candidatus Micrarchaeota archaeon]